MRKFYAVYGKNSLAVASDYLKVKTIFRRIKEGNCKKFSTFEEAEAYAREHYRILNGEKAPWCMLELNQIYSIPYYFAAWGAYGLAVFSSKERLKRGRPYLGNDFGYEECDSLERAKGIARFNYNSLVNKKNPFEDFNGELVVDKIRFRKEFDTDYKHYVGQQNFYGNEK